MTLIQIGLIIVLITFIWTERLYVVETTYVRALDRIHKCRLCLMKECDALQLNYDSLKPTWIVILSPFVWSQKSCFKRNMYNKLVQMEENCATIEEKKNETH